MPYSGSALRLKTERSLGTGLSLLGPTRMLPVVPLNFGHYGHY